MRKKNISKIIENKEKDVSLRTEVSVQPIVQAIIEPVKADVVRNSVPQSVPMQGLYHEKEYAVIIDRRNGIESIVHRKQAKLLINTGFYYEKR